jgi:hypothetical protein
VSANSVVYTLQIAVLQLEIFTAKYGLKIATSKTKTVAFNPLNPELNPIC